MACPSTVGAWNQWSVLSHLTGVAWNKSTSACFFQATCEIWGTDFSILDQNRDGMGQYPCDHDSVWPYFFGPKGPLLDPFSNNEQRKDGSGNPRANFFLGTRPNLAEWSVSTFPISINHPIWGMIYHLNTTWIPLIEYRKSMCWLYHMNTTYINQSWHFQCRDSPSSRWNGSPFQQGNGSPHSKRTGV